MISELLNKIDEYQKVIAEYRPFEDVGILKELQLFYRVGMVYSSNAIEGYTYTLSETKILLEEGLTAGGKSLRDAYAVIGHAHAYDYMFTLLKSLNIDENDILKFHSLLGESLGNNAVAGQYRDKPAFITGSKYEVANFKDIKKEMDCLFDFVKNERHSLHPVELAAHLHKRLVFIHPFADGNGRVSRLAMNTTLIQNNYLPTIISPVLRQEYIDTLESAHKNDKEFIIFICKCELETQKEMIRFLKGYSHEQHATASEKSQQHRFRMR